MIYNNISIIWSEGAELYTGKRCYCHSIGFISNRKVCVLLIRYFFSQWNCSNNIFFRSNKLKGTVLSINNVGMPVIHTSIIRYHHFVKHVPSMDISRANPLHIQGTIVVTIVVQSPTYTRHHCCPVPYIYKAPLLSSPLHIQGTIVVQSPTYTRHHCCPVPYIYKAPLLSSPLHIQGTIVVQSPTYTRHHCCPVPYIYKAPLLSSPLHIQGTIVVQSPTYTRHHCCPVPYIYKAPLLSSLRLQMSWCQAI